MPDRITEQAGAILQRNGEFLIVTTNAGGWSIPKGGVERGETTAEAALREAEEEVGLAAKGVTVLGSLGDFLGPRWKTVRAIVGTVPSGTRLTRDPREVEAAFAVPLATLACPDVYEARMLAPHVDDGWGGYTVHVFRVGPRPVWGFTGEIIADLLEAALGWEPPKPPRIVTDVGEIRRDLP